MRKTLLIAAIAAVISSPAFAATLKPGYPVCISEDLLDQTYKAILAKDVDALQYLSRNGCAVTHAAVKVTVLDLSGWGALAHLRAYRGKHSTEVWASREALEGYQPLQP
jgi:hypothetical protein